jgi:glutamine amidotransferase
MILATGRFRTGDVLAAAVAMSEGDTAAPDAPIRRHPDGWGALWRRPDGGFETYRDTRSMVDSVAGSPVEGVQTDFLVVHARHATRPGTTGLGFTHPLVRGAGRAAWYFVHNGFMPTVHRRLGLVRSEFDSAEYFDYIVPAGAQALAEQEVVARLGQVEPGGTSANAIAVSAGRAWVIHWTADGSAAPEYFTMRRLGGPDSVVIASDVVPALGSRPDWAPLPPRCLVEVPLAPAA